jgi:hypothetical protein
MKFEICRMHAFLIFVHDPEDEGNIFMRIIGLPPIYIALQLRIPYLLS